MYEFFKDNFDVNPILTCEDKVRDGQDLGSKSISSIKRFGCLAAVRKRLPKFQNLQTGRTKLPVRYSGQKDLLPEDCPDCRILTWDYDSHVSRFWVGGG